jgi:hypothetical protein
MTFSYTRHLGLLLLCFGCALPLVAQRDTIQIRGQAFVLVTEEVVGNDDLQRQVHLLRLEGGRAKWLLRHTLLAESADCNSIALELGGYAVSDTGITFYTTWMHTAQGSRASVVCASKTIASPTRVAWCRANGGAGSGSHPPIHAFKVWNRRKKRCFQSLCRHRSQQTAVSL